MGKEKSVDRERVLLNSLKDRNSHIINLLTTALDEKNLYFIMEHAPNGSLDDLIKACKGRLGENIVKILFA